MNPIIKFHPLGQVQKILFFSSETFPDPKGSFLSVIEMNPIIKFHPLGQGQKILFFPQKLSPTLKGVF
jgi:hypothetical protein